MKKSLLTSFLVLLGASNAFAAKGLDGLEGLEPKYALAAAAVALLAGFIGAATGRLGKQEFIPLVIACIVVALVPLVGWVNALVLLGVLAGVICALVVCMRKPRWLGFKNSSAHAQASNTALASSAANRSRKKHRPKITIGNRSFVSMIFGLLEALKKIDINVHYDSATGLVTLILWHGMSRKKAMALLKDLWAVVIGNGSVYGYGWYLAVWDEAKKYAGKNGVMVKVRIQVPLSLFITWAALNDPNNAPSFSEWRQHFGRSDKGWNITE
ncbi:MAG: hypothetical protein K9K33_18825 [Desulfarculaceae bacterium]|nr:hypothetical protein [Desulfarculaceae bacterium]